MKIVRVAIIFALNIIKVLPAVAALIIVGLVAASGASAQTFQSTWLDRFNANTVNGTSNGATLALDKALSDLETLAASNYDHYPYLQHYERLYKFDFKSVVEQSRRELRYLGVKNGGVVYANDAVDVMQKMLAVFHDSHHRVSKALGINLTYDPSLTLGIGLQYFQVRDRYLVYKASSQILKQLNMSAEQFTKARFVLKAVEGISMKELANKIAPLMPYKNPATVKTYAGYFLSSSKGLGILAYLVRSGKFPQPSAGHSEAIALTLQARGKSSRVINVIPGPLLAWDMKDPAFEIERGPVDFDYGDKTPEKVASVTGTRFLADSLKKTYLISFPTWAADIAETPQIRTALYDWINTKLSTIDPGPDSTLIIDTRWNRGGDPVLWRPLVDIALDADRDEAIVPFVIQPSSTVFYNYNIHLGEPVEANVHLDSNTGIDHDTQDYGPYSYTLAMAEGRYHAGNLSSTAYEAIKRVHQSLIDRRVMSPGASSLDPRPGFGENRYTVYSDHPGVIKFKGRIIVLSDRLSFSANSGLLVAFRALRKQLKKNILFIGEEGEEGSGSGRSDYLPNLNINVQTAAFMTYDYDGRLVEDAHIHFLPDLKFGLDSMDDFENYCGNPAWLIDQVLKLVGPVK